MASIAVNMVAADFVANGGSIVAPNNGSVKNTSTVSLNCAFNTTKWANDTNESVKNVTLWTNITGSFVQTAQNISPTNASTVNATYIFIQTSINDNSTIKWNCLAFDNSTTPNELWAVNANNTYFTINRPPTAVNITQ